MAIERLNEEKERRWSRGVPVWRVWKSENERKIVFLDKFIYFSYIYLSQIWLSIILPSFGKETVSVLIINKFG